MNSDTDSESGVGHRLFYALWPTEAVRIELVACIHGLTEYARGRWVPRGNLHLTLSFLGPVNPSRSLALANASAVAVNSFELELSVIRYLGRRALLWIEPTTVPRDLPRLAAALQSAPAHRPGRDDVRAFSAHVTLGRKVLLKTRLPEAIAPVVWTVESYALVESVLQPFGPQYRVLKTWPLRSMPAAGSVK